jgi:hypothetical protein
MSGELYRRMTSATSVSEPKTPECLDTCNQQNDLIEPKRARCARGEPTHWSKSLTPTNDSALRRIKYATDDENTQPSPVQCGRGWCFGAHLDVERRYRGANPCRLTPTRRHQFNLTIDVVNPLMRPAGVLIPQGAGQRGLQAGFGQIEAQIIKPRMMAEVTCVSKPWTIIPRAVTSVQDFIAAGQFRGGLVFSGH